MTLMPPHLNLSQGSRDRATPTPRQADIFTAYDSLYNDGSSKRYGTDRARFAVEKVKAERLQGLGRAQDMTGTDPDREWLAENPMFVAGD
jgi:hypothetical protein